MKAASRTTGSECDNKANKAATCLMPFLKAFSSSARAANSAICAAGDAAAVTAGPATDPEGEAEVEGVGMRVWQGHQRCQSHVSHVAECKRTEGVSGRSMLLSEVQTTSYRDGGHPYMRAALR